jgi:hypothetical protein
METYESLSILSSFFTSNSEEPLSSMLSLDDLGENYIKVMNCRLFGVISYFNDAFSNYSIIHHFNSELISFSFWINSYV